MIIKEIEIRFYKNCFDEPMPSQVWVTVNDPNNELLVEAKLHLDKNENQFYHDGVNYAVYEEDI